jgi:beta-lactam-binding protein with PASTA domain
MAEEAGLRLRCPTDAGMVVWQFPSPDRVMLTNDELLVEVKKKTSEAAVMPDLKGLPIRRASAFLDHMGIEYAIKGRGIVAEQSIQPAHELQAGQTCQLVCQETQTQGASHQAKRADPGCSGRPAGR